MSTPPPPTPGKTLGAKVMLALMILICVVVIGTLIGGVSSFRALQSPGTTTVVAEPSPSSVAESYAPAAGDTEVTEAAAESSAAKESASSSTATTTARATAPEGVTVIVSDQRPGEYRNLGVSGPTSAEFAQQVQKDYLASGNGGTVTLQSYSPVTGRTITMTCAPQGDYVLCSGGANANVYLW